MARIMALASLKYDAAAGVEETKGGLFIYSGDAGRFHDWEFRTSIRWESTKDDEAEKRRTMSP